MNIKNLLSKLLLAATLLTAISSQAAVQIVDNSVVIDGVKITSHNITDIHNSSLYGTLQAYPAHTKQLISCVTKDNIINIDYFIISKIIQAGPAYTKQLISCITKDNISKIPWYVITDIINKYPYCAKQLASHINKDNFKSISFYIIGSILILEPASAKRLASYITRDNITEIQSPILLEIVKAYPACAQQLASYITKDNFKSISAPIKGSTNSTICSILRFKPAFAKQLASYITRDNISKIPWYVISDIIVRYPYCARRLASCITKDNIAELNNQVISHIYKYLSPTEQKILIKTIEQAYPRLHEQATRLENYIFSNCDSPLWALKNACLSKTGQSEQHYKKHPGNPLLNMHGQSFKKICLPTPVRLMLINLVRKERTEQSKGRYTLIHSQKNSWTLRSDIFKGLIELIIKQPIGNYHFLRFKADDCTHHTFSMPLNQLDHPDEDHMIFMNHALHGNTDQSGESSFSYFVRNKNCQDNHRPLKELFASFGMSHYYKKYKTGFERLEKMTNESNYGSLLLFSFTPKLLKKSTHVSAPEGYKRTVYVNWHETDNIITIMDALRNNANQVTDDNHLQYFAILNDLEDGLLNPWNKGVRMYTYCPAQTAKYRRLLRKLFQNIAKDIAANNDDLSTAHKAILKLYPWKQPNRFKKIISQSIHY
ncbi:hypothetical protein HOF26_01050 [bacterium]|nr:hypothetical protein [bacterium]